VFNGQTPLAVRLTALSALGDVVRLLLFPLHLRVDYSPQERTAVTGLADLRLWIGVLVLAAWALLLILALKRGRKFEAFGLGWIAIAYAPVANLFFPIGLLVAERTLYLPSVGLVLAAGGVLQGLPTRRLAATAGVLALAGGVRTMLRVPVWRDTLTATASLLEDAPLSYRTYDLVGWQFLWARRTEQALGAFLHATELFPHDQHVYLAAADAAFTLKRFTLGDSLLARVDAICPQCPASYANQAGAARLRGDSASADSLVAHERRRRSP
jgi:protein O-mannosyl-transferase